MSSYLPFEPVTQVSPLPNFCIANAIGLDFCGLPVPDTGFYINSLAGISNERLEKVADSDKKNLVGVWSDILARAWQQFQQDVLLRLNEKALFNSDLQVNREMQLTKPPAFNNPKAVFNGVYNTTIYYIDKYTIFHLNEFHIWAVNGAKSVDLVVYDLQDGTLMYHTQVDVVPGFNRFQINKSFPVIDRGGQYYIQQYFVGIDTSNIETAQNMIFVWGDSCKPEFEIFTFGSMPLTSSPSTDNQPLGALPTNVQFGNGTYIDFEVSCSMERFICVNRRALALQTGAWKWLLAKEIMSEIQFSDRLNKYTTVLATKAEKLHDSYDKKYQDSLKLAMRNTLIYESTCVQCGGWISEQINIP